MHVAATLIGGPLDGHRYELDELSQKLLVPRQHVPKHRIDPDNPPVAMDVYELAVELRGHDGTVEGTYVYTETRQPATSDW